MSGGPVKDEELGGIGIFPLIRHRYGPSHVVGRGAVELVGEVFVPDTLPAFARAGGVAALDHEVANVAVEDDAVVVPLFGELDEIPHRFRGKFGVEFEREVAEGGGEAGVALSFHAPRLQHVFFVCEEGALGGGVRGKACGSKGGSGFASGVLGGVVRDFLFRVRGLGGP